MIIKASLWYQFMRFIRLIEWFSEEDKEERYITYAWCLKCVVVNKVDSACEVLKLQEEIRVIRLLVFVCSCNQGTSHPWNQEILHEIFTEITKSSWNLEICSEI